MIKNLHNQGIPEPSDWSGILAAENLFKYLQTSSPFNRRPEQNPCRSCEIPGLHPGSNQPALQSSWQALRIGN